MPKLGPIQWVIILFFFAIGIICLLISKQIQNDDTYSLIFELVGAFLVVAIPLEILREFFFEKANKEAFVKEVGELFDEKIEKANRKAFVTEVSNLFDEKIEGAAKLGLNSIIDSLSADRLSEIFGTLKPGDILWWHYTYCPGHKMWRDSVTKAVKRGASVKMLVLDPESQFSAMRAEEIGYSKDSFDRELRLFIGDFEESQKILENEKDSLGHLEIVRYDGLLGVPCIVVTRRDQSGNDSPFRAYSSTYLSRPTGVNFPHFVWNWTKKDDMCDTLYQYVRGKYDREIRKKLQH
jgi:hypothetical protein